MCALDYDEKNVIQTITAFDQTKESPTNRTPEDFVSRLHELIAVISETPSLLKGPVRSIRIEPHWRPSRSENYFDPKLPIVTNRIRLIGHWISKTGLSREQQVKVIPMDKILIIVPEETNCKM